MSAPVVELRAHHGMCLAFFEGKGYSQGFTAHMQTVLDGMQPDSLVKLVTRRDIICTACPNLHDGLCNTPELVLDFDTQVLKRCGLTEGAILPWSDFTELVAGNIIAAGCRESICGACQWTSICKSREHTPNF